MVANRSAGATLSARRIASRAPLGTSAFARAESIVSEASSAEILRREGDWSSSPSSSASANEY